MTNSKVTKKHYLCMFVMFLAISVIGAFDGGNVAVAGETIENSPPVIAAIDPQVVSEGQPLDLPIVITDADGDEDIIPLTTTDIALPREINPNDNDAPEIVNGHFQWTPGHLRADPTKGQSTYEFSLQATDRDGAKSEERRFQVRVDNVNRPVKIVSVEGERSSKLVDGAFQPLELTVKIADDDTDNTWNYSATINGVAYPDFAATGVKDTSNVLTWTPTKEHADKTISIIITVSDNAKPGQSADIERVNVFVGDVNKPPVLTVKAEIAEGLPTTVGDEPISIKEFQLLKFTAIASDPDGTDPVIAIGNPKGVLIGTTEVKWFPSIGEAGLYSFIFTAKDAVDSSIFTRKVVVVSVEAPPNKQPRFFDDLTPLVKVVNEGEEISFTVAAFDPDPKFARNPKGDVIEPEKLLTPLTITATGLPAGAQLSDQESNMRKFTWTPDYDVANSDSPFETDVIFTVDDGAGEDNSTNTQTYHITVQNVNRKPLVSISRTSEIKEGESLTITVKAKDPDTQQGQLAIGMPKEDKDRAEIPGVTKASETFDPRTRITTAVFTWTAPYDWATADKTPLTKKGTFIITDDDGGEVISNPVNFTASDVNQAPNITSVTASPFDFTIYEGNTITITVTATDEDAGDIDNLILDILPFSIEGTRTTTAYGVKTWVATWKPDSKFVSGTETSRKLDVTITVSDGKGGTDVDTITVIVKDVNQPPAVSDIPDFPVNEAQLVDGTVSPDTGTIETTFEFSILYYDPDNEGPIGHVTVEIDNNPSATTMEKDQYDNDYTDGVKYTASIRGLNAGKHTYTFKAYYPDESNDEPDGKIPITSESFNLTVDNTPPTVSNVSTFGNTGDITVNYDLKDPDGDTANIRLEYSSDGEDWKSSITRNNIAPGRGNNLNWASDANANGESYILRVVPYTGDSPMPEDYGRAGISPVFFVDNVPPAQPVITDIDGINKADIVGGDNFFGASFLVTGTAEANSEVRGYVDNSSAFISASADDDGNYQLLFSDLADGAHFIAVSAFDGINEGQRSTNLAISVDTIPPTIDILSPGEIQTRTPVLSANIADVGIGLDTSALEVEINGVAHPMTYNEATKTASYTLSNANALPHGRDATAIFRAKDRRGLKTEETLKFNVSLGACDKTAPRISIVSPKKDALIGGSGGKASFEIIAIFFEYSTGIDTDSIEVTLDGVPLSPVTFSQIRTSEIQISVNATDVPDGPHTITVKVKDKAEIKECYEGFQPANEAELSFDVTVDATAPDAPTFYYVPQFTKQTSLTLTGKAEDGAEVEVLVNGESAGNRTADGGFFNIGIELSLQGANIITAIATDNAGNRSPVSTTTITLDTVAPMISMTPENGAIIGGDSWTPSIFARITDELSGIGNNAIVEFQFDGVAIDTYNFNADTNTGWFSYTHPDTVNEAGEHTILLTAQDKAGNKYTHSIGVEFQKGVGDNVRPVFFNSSVKPVLSNGSITPISYNIFADVSDDVQLNDKSFKITVSVTTAGGDNPVHTYVAGEYSFEFDAESTTKGTLKISIDEDTFFPTFTTLPDGDYTVEMQVSDSKDNVATEVINFSRDTSTIAPTLTYSPAVDKNYVHGDAGQVFTNDPYILINNANEGTAEPGAQINFYMSADANPANSEANFIGTVRADANGNFSMYVSLRPGGSNIQVKAKDANGNTAVSNVIKFELDLYAPVISGLRVMTGRLNRTGEERINDPNAIVAFSLNDDSAGVDFADGNEPQIIVKRNDVEVSGSPIVISEEGDITRSLPFNAGDGSYSVEVTASDRLGNATSSTVTFILDTAAPVVSIDTPGLPAGKDYAIMQTDLPNISATIGSATNPAEDIDVNGLELRLSKGHDTFEDAVGAATDKVSHIFASTAVGGNLLYVPVEALTDMKFYKVEFIVFDLAGNQSSASPDVPSPPSKIFQVMKGDDTNPPVISQLVPADGDKISTTQIQIISFVLADDFTGVDATTVLIEVNSVVMTLDALLGTGSAQFNRLTGQVTLFMRQFAPNQFRDPLYLGQLERSLAIGTNVVSVIAGDKAGNFNEVTWSFTITVDSPEVPKLDPIKSPTKDAKITVTGTVADVSASKPVTATITVNGAIAGRANVNATDGTFKVENVRLSKGINSIAAYATDNTANQSKSTSAVNVTLDQVPPVVTLQSLPPVANQYSLKVKATITDNIALPPSTVNLILNGESQKVIPAAEVERQITLRNGENTIVIEAFDAAGNRGMSSEAKVELNTIPSWDVNNDSVVDISDLVLVGKEFGSKGNDLKGDVNGDKVVDISDMVLVGKHLGEKYGANEK